jgi:uncharacterized SAM-binding protein YcdF (DUF218 family)
MSPGAFALYKLLGLAALPLTWIWGLLLIAVILLCFPSTPRRTKLARWISGVALLLLWGLSAGPISAYLVGALEQAYPPFGEIPTTQHDAIVILASGMLTESGARPSAELTPATLQNMLCGVKAFSQGISKKLVISGDIFETNEMAKVAQKLAVPDEAVVIENASRTTYENAINVQRLLGLHMKILLVTPAIQTLRAVRVFQKHGLEVTPYPCGYQTSLKLWTWPHMGFDGLVPNASVLARSTMALHEILGLAVYELLEPD